MSIVLTLTNAAKLQGYLMATKAPKQILDLAGQIIEVATRGLSEDEGPVQRVPNEEAKIPEPAVELAAAIATLAKTAPSHDESRFAATETAQAEEKQTSVDVDSGGDERAPVATGVGILTDSMALASVETTSLPLSPAPSITLQTARGRNPENVWEDWQLEKLQEMKAAEAGNGEIAKAVNKTPMQVSNKWLWLRKKLKPANVPEIGYDLEGVWPTAIRPEKVMKPVLPDPRQEAIDRLLAEMPEADDAKNSAFKRDDIPRILKLLEDLPLSDVAKRLSCSNASTVDNHLKRYGIDYRLLPAKSERRVPLPEARPMMTFKTVAIRDSWGNDNEIQVPEPLEETTDPATGAPITKYPAGYAFGAHPPRSVHVKGGS